MTTTLSQTRIERRRRSKVLLAGLCALILVAGGVTAYAVIGARGSLEQQSEKLFLKISEDTGQ